MAVQYGPCYASCYISTPAVTTIATVDVPIKIGGATTVGLLNGFTHTSPGKLTYTGNETKVFHVSVNAIIDPAAHPAALLVGVGKNGTQDAATLLGLNVAAHTVPTSFTTHGLISLVTGDYIEVFIENNTDNGNVEFDVAQFVVVEV